MLPCGNIDTSFIELGSVSSIALIFHFTKMALTSLKIGHFHPDFAGVFRGVAGAFLNQIYVSLEKSAGVQA